MAEAEHTVLYRAVADFSELMREAALARAQMAALSGELNKFGKTKPGRLISPDDAKAATALTSETNKLTEALTANAKARQQMKGAAGESNALVRSMAQVNGQRNAAISSSTQYARALTAEATATKALTDATLDEAKFRRAEELHQVRLSTAKDTRAARQAENELRRARIQSVEEEAEILGRLGVEEKAANASRVDTARTEAAVAKASSDTAKALDQQRISSSRVTAELARQQTAEENLGAAKDRRATADLLNEERLTQSFLRTAQQRAAIAAREAAQRKREDDEARRRAREPGNMGLADARSMAALRSMAAIVNARAKAEERSLAGRTRGLFDARDVPDIAKTFSQMAAVRREAWSLGERYVKDEEQRAERVRKAWEKAHKSRGGVGRLMLELAYPQGPETAGGGGGGGGGRRRGRGGDEDFGGERASRGLSGMLRHNLAVQALVRLLPLIPPLVGAATASFAGLGAAAVAALGGIIPFAVAAVGHIKNIKDAVDDFQKTGVMPAGPMGQMVDTVYRLKAAYDDFLRATQGPVFDVFNKSIAVAITLLDKFEPIVNAAAQGLSHVAEMVAVAADSEEFQRFLDFLERQAPHAIESFGAGLINIVQGVMNLAVALEPFVDWFLDGFVKMTATFREWADGLRESEALRDFFAWAQEQGPAVVEMIKSLGDALIEVGRVLAPLGGLAVTLLTALAKFIDWGIEFVPLFDKVILLLGALTIALKVKEVLAGASALGLLTKAIRGLFVAETAAKFVASISAWLQTFQVSAGAATIAANGLKFALRGLLIATGIGAAFVAVTALVEAFTGSTNDATEAAQREKEALDDLTRSIYENNGALTESQKLKNVQLAEEWGAYDVAKYIGVDEAEMTRAVTGDAEAIQNIIDKGRAKIAEHIRKAEEAEAKGDRGKGRAERMAASGLQYRLDIFEKFTGNILKAQEGAERLEHLMDSAGDSALGAAASQKKFNDVLKAMGEGDPSGPLTKAIDALDSWREAVAAAAAAEADWHKAQAEEAENNRQAALAVKSAEYDVTAAQRDQLAAQRALTEARKDATDKLEDLRNELADIALNEDEAQLGLDRALDNLRKARANPEASKLDRREAELAVRRARADQRDTKVESGRIRRDYKAREEAGIEGSPEVLAAQDRLWDSTERLREANEKLTTARANVTKVEKDGARATAEAKTRYDQLKQKAVDAGVALDTLAAASGRTREQLIKDAAEMNAIKIDIQARINTGELDTLEERLGATMALYIAVQMANDPINAGVPFSELHERAKRQVAEMMSHRAAPTTVPRNKKGASGRAGRDNYAEGGEVDGPGTSTSDSVPAMLSKGEHVWTAAEVVAAGGHAVIGAMRQAVKSGAVPVAVLRDIAINGARMRAGGAVLTRGFDVSSLYAGLGAGARAVTLPVARFADGGEVSSPATQVVNNNTKGGMQFGDVVINNPVRERSDRSLRRTVQTLTFLHDH